MSGRLLCGAIKNLSNTCYLSCTLQIFLRYKPFTKKIKELKDEFPDVEIFSIISNLSDSFENDQKVLNPHQIIEILKYDPTKQEDICEFITKFLAFIAEKLPKERQHEIEDLFSSKIIKEGENTDAFFFYTIPVPLENEDFHVEEILVFQLDGNKEKFSKMPGMFFIQIQRMLYNKDTQDVFKNAKPVPICTSLDLTEYNGKKYKLFCSVQHIGSGKGGHYRAGIRDSEGWIMASDSNVFATTLGNIIETSNSSTTPAYLLVFVEDLDDVITLRKDVIFENDEDEVNAIVLDDVDIQNAILRSFRAQQIGDSSSSSSLMVSPQVSPKKTDQTFSPRRANDEAIKCAFTPNQDAQRLSKRRDKLTMVYQVFNPIDYTFKEPDITEYSDINDLTNNIKFYSEQMNLSFGFLGNSFTKKIPKDIEYYDVPLYVIGVEKSFKTPLRNPSDSTVVRVAYFMVNMRFTMLFDRNQPSGDILKYGKRFVEEAFGVTNECVAYINLDYYLAKIKKGKQVSFFTTRENPNAISVSLYTIPFKIPEARKSVPIHVYHLNSYTQIKEEAITPTPRTNISMINQKIGQKAQIWVLFSQDRALRLTDKTINTIYKSKIEVRALICDEKSLTLFVVLFKDGKSKYNFFVDASSCNDIEDLRPIITKCIKSSSFILEFIVGDVPKTGNIKELAKLHLSEECYVSVSII